MALPPLELPPIEKGSPCCRAALLLLRVFSSAGVLRRDRWRTNENRGRSSFVAEDVTAEIRLSARRGICAPENRRDSGKATLARKLRSREDKPMPTLAVSLTTVVMIAVLALVALAGRMERDELE